ncbi:hypothetical protein, variant [Exophiala dermatitidis NIH/UT8656]|uniref:Uncharacterized protein n=1 Tax=Exophiala dermatitidis (strain ATCC 34100 / CBS 525.76 / NIH/UT8656) TaxID=858893 RepID=H6BTI4_EXODN|nr:uncharacterized protein HMPREF1120_03549 [Exophiala dermatitidis NIH/UT8656]XP_009155873.1 hypothetical protein, variant [Exophiala dermatitidis NIH/UT8656]EHY55411.1 hypothetical protein, variant [Exophiala dermatitidis NIH/UT8656]EHY55412.1 hypothetical protein HMPREF1120_03549 [Exophiala dermatitidis NIH/UT8656]
MLDGTTVYFGDLPILSLDALSMSLSSHVLQLLQVFCNSRVQGVPRDRWLPWPHRVPSLIWMSRVPLPAILWSFAVSSISAWQTVTVIVVYLSMSIMQCIRVEP